MGQIRQWARDNKRSAFLLAGSAFILIAAAGSTLGFALSSGPAPSLAACTAAVRSVDLSMEKTGKPPASEGAKLEAACHGFSGTQVQQIAYQVAASDAPTP